MHNSEAKSNKKTSVELSSIPVRNPLIQTFETNVPLPVTLIPYAVNTPPVRAITPIPVRLLGGPPPPPIVITVLAANALLQVRIVLYFPDPLIEIPAVLETIGVIIKYTPLLSITVPYFVAPLFAATIALLIAIPESVPVGEADNVESATAPNQSA